MIKKEELQEIALLPLNDYMRDPVANHYIMRATSGTTQGKPLLICRRRFGGGKGIKLYQRVFAPAFFYGSYNARLSHLSQFFVFNKDPTTRALVVAPQDINEQFGRLLEEFGPDCLCGFPSFIVNALLSIDDRYAATLNNIKSVCFIGEPMSGARLDVIKKKIPNAVIYGYYAAAETGFISGDPCGKLQLNTYHPANNVDIEIINPDEDGIGEIVVSLSLSDTVRLERYIIGDMGRFLPGLCDCGAKLTFEVLGRKSFDFIKHAGTILTQELFERALQYFAYVADFRVLMHEELEQGRLFGGLTIEVLLHNNSALSEEEKGKCRDELEKELPIKLQLTPTRTLMDLVADGAFVPLRIELKDTFPYQHKGVKMKKIL